MRQEGQMGRVVSHKLNREDERQPRIYQLEGYYSLKQRAQLHVLFIIFTQKPEIRGNVVHTTGSKLLLYNAFFQL